MDIVEFFDLFYIFFYLKEIVLYWFSRFLIVCKNKCWSFIYVCLDIYKFEMELVFLEVGDNIWENVFKILGMII